MLEVIDMEVIDLAKSSPPMSPMSGKRKYKEDSSSVKKPKSSLVELRGRKLLFGQVPFERPPLPRRQLLKLQMDLLDAKEDGTPLTALPEKYLGLVAMAGHELTCATEAALVKAIKAELTKGNQDDFLPVDLLADPVKQLFSLTQYGFTAADFGGGARFPAGLQIRVWEANDVNKYFPAENVAYVLDRRAERQRAREECIRLLAAMDDLEKHELFKGDKGKDEPAPVPAPAPARALSAPRSRDVTPAAGAGAGAPSSCATPSPTKRVKSAEDEAEAKRKQEEKEAKKAEREEKKKEHEEKKAEREALREAKRAELEEKKAEKGREEQKKAEVKAKQQQSFASFFKAKKEVPSPKPSPVAGPSSVREKSAEASSSRPPEDEYRKAFKPPPERANVKWHTVNDEFRASLKQKDDTSVAGWAPRDFINDHLKRHGLPTQTPREGLRGLKTPGPPLGSMADMYAQYQSAMDPRRVRKYILNLDKFPQKVLAFDQQARPPYTGTFSKPSVVVGPRTPFQCDPLFDYSYDSGDDWMDEEGGDDVNDQDPEAEGDEDNSGSEEEDEFDDWLDDTEDALFGPDADGDVPMVGGRATDLPNAPSVPNAPDDLVAKRKIPVKRIAKLVQDCLGPFWENEIGKHPKDDWNLYRIKLLNDTPYSIDPFKYQSAEPAAALSATFTDTAVGMQVGVKCLLSTEEVAPAKAAPAPAPTMPLGDASSTANASANTTSNTNTPARARSAPKVAFPTAQLPDLLRKIEGSPKIQSDLVSELRSHFDTTTKAAIEAKIREVASREGKGKESRWRVKADAWTLAGLTPPPRGIMAAFDKA